MITADTITDEQIRDLLASLDRAHYARQWCIDALGPASLSHPNRKRNARRYCAELAAHNRDSKLFNATETK